MILSQPGVFGLMDVMTLSIFRVRCKIRDHCVCGSVCAILDELCGDGLGASAGWKQGHQAQRSNQDAMEARLGRQPRRGAGRRTRYHRSGVGQDGCGGQLVNLISLNKRWSAERLAGKSARSTSWATEKGEDPFRRIFTFSCRPRC